MRSSPLLLRLLLLAVISIRSNAGYVTWNHIPVPIVVGQQNRLVWSSSKINEPAVVSLLRGGGLYPSFIDNVGMNVTGGKWDWSPDPNLENGDDYALRIEQESTGAFVQGCKIAGGKPAGSESSGTSSVSGSINPAAHNTLSAQSPPTKPSSNDQRPESAAQGLDTNVAIGIGVGAGVLILALLSAVLFVCYRLRKLQQERRTTVSIGKPTYHGSSLDLVDNQPRNLYPFHSTHEKEGQARPGELVTYANRFEIEGRQRSQRYELGY